MSTVKPFGMVELGVRQVLVNAGADPALVGGDFRYEGGPAYIRLELTDSDTDRLEGDFAIDVEVFAEDYVTAISRSLDLEALLLGYPHVVQVEGYKWVFDRVFQNVGPRSLPWEDDGVERVGATYVLTARRR